MTGRTVLALGATGMLWPAVRDLAVTGDRVVVVSRHGVPPDAPAAVVDVRHHWSAWSTLSRTVADSGLTPVDLALLWVHSPWRDPVRAEVEQLTAPGGTLVEVLGSAAARPAVPEPPPGPTELRRRYLRLGFVLDGSGSRWLTREEIGSGLAAFLATDDTVGQVGTLEPWERRP